MRNLSIVILLITLLFGCQPGTDKTATSNYELPTDMASIGRVLDSIFVEDQKYRRELNEIAQKHGWESDEFQNHWKKISETDASNLVVVEQVLEKHGWLSLEEIGQTANSTLFFVIQHADQQTQEKYLPMMRQAVEDGKANATSLALLEDRVALGRGESQIYGSQLAKDAETGEMYVRPLRDPANVNERRAAVGLGPIEEYIAQWNVEWNLAEYEKKLPQRIERLKAITR